MKKVENIKIITCLNVAFCTSGMTMEDLNSIAVINRIALNLENMQWISEGLQS